MGEARFVAEPGNVSALSQVFSQVRVSVAGGSRQFAGLRNGSVARFVGSGRFVALYQASLPCRRSRVRIPSSA